MHKSILIALAAAGLTLATAAQAQAPAGAPAGANGICKDGTYSMAASKDGACRGHKGVQTWYATAPAKPSASTTVVPAAMPAPTLAPAAKSMPVPTPAASAPAMPAPTPAASTSGKRLSPEAAAAQKPQVPGGGPGLVWVNTSSNVYHCNGDPFYGKTKAGAYMSEADAKAKGAHGDAGKSCAGK